MYLLYVSKYFKNNTKNTTATKNNLLKKACINKSETKLLQAQIMWQV